MKPFTLAFQVECERAINIGSEAANFDKDADICIEEMAELTQALLHARRGRGSFDAMREELADVIFTVGKLYRWLGSDEVDAQLSGKIGRLKERRRCRK